MDLRVTETPLAHSTEREREGGREREREREGGREGERERCVCVEVPADSLIKLASL